METMFGTIPVSKYDEQRAADALKALSPEMRQTFVSLTGDYIRDLTLTEREKLARLDLIFSVITPALTRLGMVVQDLAVTEAKNAPEPYRFPEPETEIARARAAREQVIYNENKARRLAITDQAPFYYETKIAFGGSTTYTIVQGATTLLTSQTITASGECEARRLTDMLNRAHGAGFRKACDFVKTIAGNLREVK